MSYQGDWAEDSTHDFKFSTRNTSAAMTTLAGTPALSVYKANGTAQSTAGITLSVDFDGVTGLHNVRIDTSADAFYAVGNDYDVVITAGTVGGVSVVGEVVGSFSIENRFAEVAVTSIAANAITATSIASDAITAAKIATGAIDADAIADNAIDAGAIADGAITAAKLATGAITSAKFAAGAIDAAAIATDAIGADEISAAAVTKIQSGLATASAVSTLQTDVSAILIDTGTDIPASLVTIAGYLDTEIAAIKAKTDNLPASPAATGDIPTATDIADAVLMRGASNVEDTADEYSLCGIILAIGNSSMSGTTWTWNKTDASVFATKTIVVDASADPITGVS